MKFVSYGTSEISSICNISIKDVAATVAKLPDVSPAKEWEGQAIVCWKRLPQ